METKFYCSKCGFSLKVTEVKDFSVPNFTELRIMIRPCTECAAQQSAQADKCPVCLGEKGAFVDGHWTDCIHCLATGKRQ